MVGVELGQVDQYRILKKLGEGGMGSVFLAHHVTLGSRVAIKVLHPHLCHRAESITRFFNEARVATLAGGPGIVTVFDFVQPSDGQAYIVMEYLEGESLGERVTRGPLPALEAIRFGAQLARTLHALHARGIVHRDLKPDNLFVVEDPEVLGGRRTKLLDFGIVKLTGQDAAMPRTRTGSIMGTAWYMSPEQCRGLSSVDYRSDIYSFGCVLFHLLSGTVPFDGEFGDVIASHIRDTPPTVSSRISGLPDGVDNIVQTCLARDPTARFRTMALVAEQLDRVLQKLTRTSERPPMKMLRMNELKRGREPGANVVSGEIEVRSIARLATGTSSPVPVVMPERRPLMTMYGLASLASSAVTLTIRVRLPRTPSSLVNHPVDLRYGDVCLAATEISASDTPDESIVQFRLAPGLIFPGPRHEVTVWVENRCLGQVDVQ